MKSLMEQLHENPLQIALVENEELREQLAKANERLMELDEIADTAFKYNHSSAQCLRAWNKLQQLRKEQVSD